MSRNSLTLVEQETVILWDNASKDAKVYTHDKKLISTGEVRVDRCISRKSGKEYPAIISLDLGPDGTVRYKMRFPDRKKKGGGTA